MQQNQNKSACSPTPLQQTSFTARAISSVSSHSAQGTDRSTTLTLICRGFLKSIQTNYFSWVLTHIEDPFAPCAPSKIRRLQHRPPDTARLFVILSSAAVSRHCDRRPFNFAGLNSPISVGASNNDQASLIRLEASLKHPQADSHPSSRAKFNTGGMISFDGPTRHHWTRIWPPL